MKRYYVCDIIGTGDPEDAFRPAVADLGLSYVAEIKSDPVTGVPVLPWALVRVATNNHAPLINTPGVDALPDYPLDGKVSSIHTATKNAMLARLQSRGIDTSFVGAADGFRDVVRGLGLMLNATFSEDSFDVSE